MIYEWTLILLVAGGGGCHNTTTASCAVSLTTIGGFVSQQSCQKVLEQTAFLMPNHIRGLCVQVREPK